jgi:hypothetical protein
MSIRSTFIVATAIATLGLGSPAFAQGFSNDTGNPRPSYYDPDGKWHTGRPPQQQAVTPQSARRGRGLYLYAGHAVPGANDPPAFGGAGMSKEMMQNDWWWGASSH